MNDAPTTPQADSSPAKRTIVVPGSVSMKKAFVVMLLGALAVTGCRTNYQVTLNNGNRITTSTKPKLVRGYYVFKDVYGHTNHVSEARVRAIEPQPRGYSEKSGSTSYERR